MSGDSRHALSEAAIAETWGRAAQTPNPCGLCHDVCMHSEKASLSLSVFGLAMLDVLLHNK